ncbi:MAG: DUF5606 domain-containing protein [Bacteroidales bacterium]|jgi:hypothetical protein|nr:DUF5606 domain-containing protein [Bacteroidales bacterium]
MVLKDILAISGEPGLFKFIAQGKNAIIVEHLETGRRSSAFTSAKVSSLEDISVFTQDEDMPLAKVFDRIYEKESGGPAIDPKTATSDVLKQYFEGIVPEYSRERVYTSDIKKIIVWYNLLQKKNMLIPDEPEKNDEQEQKEKVAEEKPVAGKKTRKSTSEPGK